MPLLLAEQAVKQTVTLPVILRRYNAQCVVTFQECDFTQSHTNYRRNISDFVFTIVPADGLAPLGARPYAGTVMVKYAYRVCIYIYIHMIFIWHI